MTQDQFRQSMAVAVRHHEAGQWAAAEAIYRQILSQVPDQPDVLHLLGAVAGQTGRLDEAIALIVKAIAVNPGQVVYHCNLSEFYRRAGRPEDAIESARQAIRLNPNLARAYCVMGSALTYLKKFDDAVAAFRRAIQLNPDYLEALNHLGSTLNSMEQFEDAIAVFRQACKVKPDSVESLCGLAIALRETGQAKEAITYLRQAIEIQPTLSSAYNNLGISLSQTDQLDEAIATFRRAIELQPENALAVKNLGVALAEKGQFEDSLIALDQAIQLKPDLSEAHGNRALVLLVTGDFERGWAEYEWRWRAQLTMLSKPRNFTQPRWDGTPLNGKTLLLHAEQGFGDTIQFVRYLPKVARLGEHIILECPLELVRLMARAPGVQRIISAGESLPGFDVHCPLLSLPLAFSTRVDSIPAEIPYLSADPILAAHWKSKIESLPPGFKVGLVWAGNPKNKNDRKRSISFDQLAPLASVPGINFFSLQKAVRGKALPPAGMNFIDWTADLQNFDDTAALIANLDLVIAVDTAVAHLAGAMGKPVWVMIPYVPDWRWLLKREDSPWYPTVRLFRQNSPGGDWPGVIRSVANALRATAPVAT